MEKKNHKFQELTNKMEVLKENEKGQLKGGFSSTLNPLLPVDAVNDYCNNNKCTGTGGENYKCSNTGCS